MRATSLFFSAFKRSITRSDFRRNPINAMRKRIWWKLRWRLSNRFWLLRLNNGMRIFVPHSGSGALIYYLGQSEPETASFFERYVRHGMVVFDVGAHLGEYTLRAARLVGMQGNVYAFEPNPALVQCIQRNVALNRLENVAVVATAIADQEGTLSFEIATESSVSALTSATPSIRRKVAQTIRVEALTLDSLWDSLGPRQIDLIKIDVEGAEYLVFKGAGKLLSQAPENAPVILFEFNRSNYADFGVTGADVVSLLAQHGYCFLKLSPQGKVQRVQLEDLIGNDQTAQNLVAAKNVEVLLKLMDIDGVSV